MLRIRTARPDKEWQTTFRADFHNGSYTDDDIVRVCSAPDVPLTSTRRQHSSRFYNWTRHQFTYGTLRTGGECAVFRRFGSYTWKAERVPPTRQLSCERTSLFSVGQHDRFSAADSDGNFSLCSRPGDRYTMFPGPRPFRTFFSGYRQRTSAASANIRLGTTADSDLYVIYTAGQNSPASQLVAQLSFTKPFSPSVHILLAP